MRAIVFLLLAHTVLFSQNPIVNIQVFPEKIVVGVNSQIGNLDQCTVQILDSLRSVVKTVEMPKAIEKQHVKQVTECSIPINDLPRAKYACFVYTGNDLIYKKEFYRQTEKILIVATNINLVGGNTSGTFLMEIVYPFKYFTDNGYTVDIVTPKGGQVAIYDAGMINKDMVKIRDSELFTAKAKSSITPDEVNVKEYGAVFYPGGHGQYFDVIEDERISLLAAKIYEAGGVVGTAGHGAVSLVNIKLSNAKYLVDGKKLTCFPHWAEVKFMNISNYGRSIPFDMEVLLTKRGANLILVPEESGSGKKVTKIVDEANRIVTGAFADDALWVAEEMGKLLEKGN